MRKVIKTEMYLMSLTLGNSMTSISYNRPLKSQIDTNHPFNIPINNHPISHTPQSTIQATPPPSAASAATSPAPTSSASSSKPETPTPASPPKAQTRSPTQTLRLISFESPKRYAQERHRENGLDSRRDARRDWMRDGSGVFACRRETCRRGSRLRGRWGGEAELRGGRRRGGVIGVCRRSRRC